MQHFAVATFPRSSTSPWFGEPVTKKFYEIDKVPTTFGGGLCYDSRKDATLVQKQVDRKFYQSSKIEEHVSLVSLPDGNFLDHIILENGKAQTVSTCIIKFLGSKHYLGDIEALACDGTNTNLGD